MCERDKDVGKEIRTVDAMENTQTKFSYEMLQDCLSTGTLAVYLQKRAND